VCYPSQTNFYASFITQKSSSRKAFPDHLRREYTLPSLAEVLKIRLPEFKF
jgi:hypothetical protein